MGAWRKASDHFARVLLRVFNNLGHGLPCGEVELELLLRFLARWLAAVEQVAVDFPEELFTAEFRGVRLERVVLQGGGGLCLEMWTRHSKVYSVLTLLSATILPIFAFQMSIARLATARPLGSYSANWFIAEIASA